MHGQLNAVGTRKQLLADGRQKEYNNLFG